VGHGEKRKKRIRRRTWNTKSSAEGDHMGNGGDPLGHHWKERTRKKKGEKADGLF